MNAQNADVMITNILNHEPSLASMNAMNMFIKHIMYSMRPEPFNLYQLFMLKFASGASWVNIRRE